MIFAPVYEYCIEFTCTEAFATANALGLVYKCDTTPVPGTAAGRPRDGGGRVVT